MGFDADNQAATMSGLLGIVHGIEGIPVDLLYPLGRNQWQQPFNDRYVNVTRHDLPDASIRDIAARTAALGEKIILANGGSIVTENGVDYYEIDSTARFTAPLELPSASTLLAEKGQPFSFRYSYIDPSVEVNYEIVAGALPPGIDLDGRKLSGTTLQTGHFSFRVRVEAGGATAEQDYALSVYGENLAQSAATILHGDADGDLEVMRDGSRRGATFLSRGSAAAEHVDYYGYSWTTPQTISTLVFNPGMPEEFGGWFTSLRVEYRDGDGKWRTAEELTIEPPINFDNSQWLKGSYIDHVLTIAPVTTTAIRIVGKAGGVQPDAHTGETLRYYTSIAGLAVYAD